MAVKQDINVGLITVIGVVGAMLLLIIVWGVQAWFAYEVDLLNQYRYAQDQNVEWIDSKFEQYTNIGDPIGNSAIYASGFSPEERAELPPVWGWRYPDENKQTLVVPIHVAMAQMVNELGNPTTPVTAEEMRLLDQTPTQTVNEAYADVMTPTEAEPQTPPGVPPVEEAETGEQDSPDTGAEPVPGAVED